MVKEYNYSHQREYNNNLVQSFIKKEEKYYSELLYHNRKNLMVNLNFIIKFRYILIIYHIIFHNIFM